MLNPEQREAVLALVRTLTAAHNEVATERDVLATERDELTTERDELTTERDVLTTERDVLATERDELAACVLHKDSEISRLQRLLYGRKSERLTREELGQLVLCYGGDEASTKSSEPVLPASPQGEAEPEEGTPQNQKTKKKRNGHRGRTRLAPELERKITPVAVPEDERNCQACGTPMEVFDYVDHERVEYVPAKLVVHVERREKLGCKVCKCDAVTAERQAVPEMPALRVGASLLAHLIESKCDDALPIHRQCD